MKCPTPLCPDTVMSSDLGNDPGRLHRSRISLSCPPMITKVNLHRDNIRNDSKPQRIFHRAAKSRHATAPPAPCAVPQSRLQGRRPGVGGGREPWLTVRRGRAIVADGLGAGPGVEPATSSKSRKDSKQAVMPFLSKTCRRMAASCSHR